MLICFYPGSGGNRYFFYLNNKFYQTPGMSFDRLNLLAGNHPRYRYLESADIYDIDDSVPVLTHCLNLEKLRYHFPLKSTFIALNSDFQSSLRRQWYLHGVELYRDYVEKNFGDQSDSNKKFEKINSAFESIKFHHEYYNTYKPTIFYSNHNKITHLVINENSDNEFCKFMYNEISLYSDVVFDFAWTAYKLHGPDAPIIDMYEKTFLQVE